MNKLPNSFILIRRKNTYPDARDLRKNPRCYDFTEDERQDAIRKVELLINKKIKFENRINFK